jgi:hypothetical protein
MRHDAQRRGQEEQKLNFRLRRRNALRSCAMFSRLVHPFRRLIPSDKISRKNRVDSHPIDKTSRKNYESLPLPTTIIPTTANVFLSPSRVPGYHSMSSDHISCCQTREIGVGLSHCAPHSPSPSAVVVLLYTSFVYSARHSRRFPGSSQRIFSCSLAKSLS